MNTTFKKIDGIAEDDKLLIRNNLPTQNHFVCLYLGVIYKSAIVAMETDQVVLDPY